MQSEKFKVTPLERSWILYDVGNSAFVLMIATLVPIFFNALAEVHTYSKIGKRIYKRAVKIKYYHFYQNFTYGFR